MNECQWFRSSDDPSHMKIKVKLSKLMDGKVNSTSPLSPDRNTVSIGTFAPITEITVGWQSKVFSPSEILQYSHLRPNATPTEQRYHAEISKMRTDENSAYARLLASGTTADAPTCLFTHIDEDHFVDADDLAKGMTTAPRETMTSMAHHILANRLKSHDIARAAEPSSASHPIVMRNPRESIDIPYKEMHIMAFLRLEQPDINSTSRHILWNRLGPNGPQPGDNLHTPGLASKITHKFEVDRRTYEYTIENASQVLTPAEEDAEYRLHYEYDRKRLKTRSTVIGNDFADIVSPQNTRVTLFGEIVSALGFGNKDLFIQYLIEFPNQWTCDDLPDQTLTGFTQDCRPTFDATKKMYKAAFSFPMEAVSVYQGLEPSDTAAPRLLLQVTSTDFWDRTNVEGYGLATIPSTPGCYDIEVPTWRPVGTFISEMRRFFIGGGAEFEDIADQSKMTQDKRRVNLYGLQTQSAGVVQVRLNVVSQTSITTSRSIALPPEPVSATRGDLRAMSAALQRARQRLEALRNKEL
ncbi:hypothetical protein SmJEL517_g00106 [Synchytrium microbalum]|uniref:Meckel syndrome type 1 protein n=1 Tax=Synchytrium microbalum TaxID=1806994 RepID=A0A507CIV9_9FUNG|nr:uncharacterized protein SmJEL517_g00106 [Synchytrium microbalum]TPX38104.1 hypothetical protein SmJEL517_g00106 [Synchytrium microbalum]